MAKVHKRQTEKNYRLFKLKPAQFNNSENVYRLYTMEHVFRVQFGIRYDPVVREAVGDCTGAWDIAKAWNTCDSTEVFIHGLLSRKRTGTCSSLPTFAIAVGRRLGYPLKLILVPNHTLYRWDDGNEVFNLQPTEAGGHVPTDEYFHTWPRKWDDIDYQMNARTKVWLHSMTPRKEVSKFLCNRALMLRECKRYEEALVAIAAACRFDPINPACWDIELSIEHVMNGGDLADYGNRGNGSTGPYLIPGAKTKFVGGFGLELPPTQVALTLPLHSENSSLAGGSAGTVVTGFAPLPPSPAEFERTAPDRRRREEAAFADEHYRLVNLINESNRNRSPQHPNGNPPTEPLMRQLTELLQSRKGR